MQSTGLTARPNEIEDESVPSEEAISGEDMLEIDFE
jgi:hypothetical protein